MVEEGEGRAGVPEHELGANLVGLGLGLGLGLKVPEHALGAHLLGARGRERRREGASGEAGGMVGGG